MCCSADVSFDLSPLTKADGSFYNLKGDGYDYYINVCAAVKTLSCPEKSGACQVERQQGVAKRWGPFANFVLKPA